MIEPATPKLPALAPSPSSVAPGPRPSGLPGQPSTTSAPVDQGGHLDPEEDNRLRELEATIKAGVRTFVDVGLALLEIRDSRLYRASHATFDAYCRERWGMSKTHANRQIDAAGVAGLLAPMGVIPATERQARELVPLAHADEQEAVEVWQELRWEHGDRVTAGLVREAVTARLTSKAHVSYNTGQNEWYTPPEYIEAARQVLGVIDLDPASTTEANAVVEAARFHTADEDGLSQEWRGRLWMNPPYASDLIGRFTGKLAAHYLAGEVEAAVVLVNNATETDWFQEIARLASAICFPDRRVRFWSPSRDTAAPLQGQAVLYLGNDVGAFREAFEDFGLILYGRTGQHTELAERPG